MKSLVEGFFSLGDVFSLTNRVTFYDQDITMDNGIIFVVFMEKLDAYDEFHSNFKVGFISSNGDYVSRNFNDYTFQWMPRHFERINS